ncbi:MAG: hypothetical protein ISR76_04415 [Planctomycetes bacterium]|nr:hypothetical protein [Planctomycetota bacterium]MBL7008217.1 hypothetical protein [Planctomycetota bacterium]
MLTTLLTLPMCWLGLTGPSPALTQVGGPNKVPIESQETLIFVGIEGDYSDDVELAMRDRLAEEFQLTVIGSPVRSITDKGQRVWALRTTESFKSLRGKLLRPMKKQGYSLVEMRASAFSTIGRESGSSLKAKLRDFERGQKYVWASHQDQREGIVWVFHEPKLKSDKVLDAMREAGMSVAFHHHEVELEADAVGLSIAGLESAAKEKLDVIAVTGKERSLVIDFYLRDLESLMALDRGRHTVACPDLSSLIGKPGATSGWAVTLENRGYPFVD